MPHSVTNTNLTDNHLTLPPPRTPPLLDFTEVMRALGYPRLISVDNFRNPNFELVADVLYWMVKRYDPDISVHEGIESEDDRVSFLTSIAAALHSKAGIRLNCKRLYAADGHAVKELLKVSTCLYDASRSSVDVGGGGQDDPLADFASGDAFGRASQLGDVKGCRALASSIAERGARLHDLLVAELAVKTVRAKSIRFLDALSGSLETGAEHLHIERSLQALLDGARDEADKLNKQVSELDSDERDLTEKIKRKQTDLERVKKRLASLQHVRPAFMDEYEKLEKDLQKQYEVYLERFRNLDYLEFELDELKKAEKEKVEEADRAMKRMQKRLREEELKILRGEQVGDGGGNGGGGADGVAAPGRAGGAGAGGKGQGGGGGVFAGAKNANERGGGGGGAKGSASGGDRPRVAGKMTGGDSDSDDGSGELSDELTNEDDDSEDVSVGGSEGSSGSSNLIDNDDGSDDDSGLEQEDGRQYENGSGGEASDDDF